MPSPVTADAKRMSECVGLTWNEAPFQMPSHWDGRAESTGPKAEANHRLTPYPNIAPKGEM